MTQEEFFKRYKYDVMEDRIGGGGFGTVYKAYDTTLHREVAIKVSEVKVVNDKTFSLRDEVEALTHVPEHPNIANYEKEKLFTFKMPNGVFDYAVMQYYPDGNLSNAIKQGLTAQQKDDIATQLLEGIAFLHKHKVVHRDLKPGNILIVRDGENIIPLITDFGLSKAADTGDGSMFTNSFGGGTPRYSSPEQLQGKPLRLNTDLWSYGAILFEIFTGEQLFNAGSGAANTAQADLEIYNKIVNGNVSSLCKMPEKWRKVAERCLVVDADKRAKDEAELLRIVSGEAQEDETVANTIKETPSLGNSHRGLPPSKGVYEGRGTESPRSASPKAQSGSNGPAIPPTETILSDDEETQVANKPQSKGGHSTAPAPSNRKPKSKKGLWITVAVVAIAAVAAIFATARGSFPSPQPSVPAEVTAVEEHLSNGGDLNINANGVNFTMKFVQGGTFQMGSNDSEASPDEQPVHSVTVSSFYMGETEVTQALWKAVMGSNPSYFKGDNLPVEQVSWNDCQEFIRNLNNLTGKNFRLPTEAEWEFAARGGNNTNHYKYAGSNTIGNVAWYDDNSDNQTHPVGTKSHNELGLYDMSGNVWEWCQDRYSDYSSGSQTNPQGPSNGLGRMLRGGSWIYIARNCRASYRSDYHPDYRFNYVGLRLCLPQ